MNKSYRTLLILALLAPTGCQSNFPYSPATLGRSYSSPSPSKKDFNPLGGLERSLIFFPSKYPDGDWRPQGVKFEDAWFKSPDGTRLHGWYFAHENPKAVVLYCHGNAGNVAYWADAAWQVVERAGASVLVFDYRGYGRSEGKPTEAGVLADARAARAWLAKKAGIDEAQVVLMGRSLGGAVAVDLAADDGARALVLESTFTTLPDVAKTLYPLLPVRALMHTRFDSKAKIADYRGPLMQSHGTTDRLVPFEIGCRLFDAANEPKKFIPIPGRDHNDPQPAEYYAALAEFLAGLP